jgi:hypothetical protein
MKSFGRTPVMHRPLSGFGAIMISTNEEAIRPSTGPISRGIQAFAFRYFNKIKTIFPSDKNFLTILNGQLGSNERFEPRR